MDIHVHFREPGDEEEETIASGSAARWPAVSRPLSVCPIPIRRSKTRPTWNISIARQDWLEKHTYTQWAPSPKQGKALELAEMGFMAEAGAVGFTDDGNGVQNPAVMLRALKYAAMFNVVIAQHCQDNSFTGDGVMNAGYYSNYSRSPGMDPLAEEAMLWRDIQLVKKTGVRYHASTFDSRCR